MALMYLDADLNSPIFSTVGNFTRFEDGQLIEGPEGADDNMFFSYQGCAGYQAYDWDFDEPAQEIVIGVEEGPQEGRSRCEHRGLHRLHGRLGQHQHRDVAHAVNVQA